MDQSLEVLTHRLLQISNDLHSRMAEIRALREAIRAAEEMRCGQQPVNPSVADEQRA